MGHVVAGRRALPRTGALLATLSLIATTAVPAAAAGATRARVEHGSRAGVLSSALVDAAVAWADQQLGAVYTRENAYARWWSGYCEAFVERAYRGRFRYWSAASDYRAEQGLRRVREGVPPRGALVFYQDGRYGHVALSVGGGWVISTVGTDADRLPVLRVSYEWFNARYLGWAMPIMSVTAP